MSKQYSPRNFFRRVQNAFLQRYFSERGLLSEINFKELKETKVDSIYEAWLNLSEECRNEIEQDFQQIDEMATEAGCKAILDEADYHGENLVEQFSKLDSSYAKAFWTFLERKRYWNGATAFNHADTISTSHWRKRKNLPDLPIQVDDESIQLFERTLGQYFYAMQGRGKNCKVEVYKRNQLDYFFAYPEDYAQASIEWENNQFNRRPHHPAFEIIFIYSKDDHTLDIYLGGDRKIVSDLQGIFVTEILKAELTPDEKDERVYDLELFRSRYFQFQYTADSGVDSVGIKKLRLKIQGSSERVIVEANPFKDKDSVYDLLEKLVSSNPNAQFVITQVGIKVKFSPTAAKKLKICDFTITWPNSCSLKYDEKSLIMRKMLTDSGVQPKLLEFAEKLQADTLEVVE